MILEEMDFEQILDPHLQLPKTIINSIDGGSGQ